MSATTQSWSKPPDSPQLIPESVDVWLFPLQHSLDMLNRMQQTLSSGEKQRAARLTKKADGDHYIAAHGILRVLLGLYMKIDPEKLAFNSDANGKPSLDTRITKKNLHFNLSHSHEYGLLAVSLDSAVGVDLEYIKKQAAFLKIAKRFFTPAEYKALQKTPKDLQKEAFFTGWCRKEALLKALGTGIAGGLNRVQVSMEPKAQSEAVQFPGHANKKWGLQNLPTLNSYAHAVAAEGSDWSLRCYLWEDSLTNRPR